MVKSMTGYGRARETRGGRDITVEVRSVNNRYLDCTVKMPRIYTFAEDAIKTRVQKAISRGKVDVFVSVDSSAADTAVVTLNKSLVEGYLADSDDGSTTDSVFGYDGKLNIRPSFQRNSVYGEAKRNAVIQTVLNECPLNTMYWVDKEDGTYECLDGQQR